MNNLTKEDLNQIAFAIESSGINQQELKNKIHSMINRYDEDRDYEKGIEIIEKIIDTMLPADCEVAEALTEALLCIDGASDE